jgi:type II secretory pathway component GspD/PulD (secretin)
MRLLNLSWWLLLLPLVSWAAPTDPLTTIELKGRSAEEIIPIIRPLLAPDDALTGKDNLLFLRTDEGTVSQIRQLLDQIDRPLNNLLITVRSGVDMSHEKAQAGVKGEIIINDPQQSEVDVRLDKRYKTEKRGSTQQLRVIEGQPAFINIGQAIPYPSGQVTHTPHGSYGNYGIQYREAPQGFYVLPRLRGDRVFIEINPRRDELSPQGGGRIDTTSLHTTITGELGEWIRLGGVDETQQGTQSGIISTGKKKSDEDREVWMRVDLIR